MLRNAAVRVRLTAGQALVFDQHRTAHARLPLGKEQHRVPPNRRRLLWQRFGVLQMSEPSFRPSIRLVHHE
ncbi:hypothetical protein [Microbispora sp. NPDC046933]|uniref:hypothetical protein n=1 Tax=Microbispora sp. NPDC046933 TaxID=3155618 RepID=UPI0033DDE931